MSKETTREAIRSLSAHPRWPVLVRLLERRRDQLVSKMLAEVASDSELIRLQGQAREASYLLEQFTAMAAPLPLEESEQQEQSIA